MEHQADIENGVVIFDAEGPGIRALVEELVQFPNAEHDDRVDAMIYALGRHTIYAVV